MSFFQKTPLQIAKLLCLSSKHLALQFLESTFLSFNQLELVFNISIFVVFRWLDFKILCVINTIFLFNLFQHSLDIHLLNVFTRFMFVKNKIRCFYFHIVWHDFLICCLFDLSRSSSSNSSTYCLMVFSFSFLFWQFHFRFFS